jgi:4-oxalocrotonate tautomerase family enzyme
MPFVIVEMWKGRTVDQKRKLVRAITDAMIQHAGCRPDHLHVVIHDVEKDSWARAGVLGIDERSPIEQEALPHVLGYGHMLIMVDDMDRSTKFYVEQLGFKIRPAKPLQDGRPFTAFHQGIALVQGRKTGERQIDHIAFEVNNVRKLRDKLKANQVEFFQDLHDGPYGLTIYIADPDGTKVELYQMGEKA